MQNPTEFTGRIRTDSTATQEIVPQSIVNRQLFSTVQYKDIYNQTLSAFQDDMQKLKQIETQRLQLGERINNHKKILQSLQPPAEERRGSVALRTNEEEVSPKVSRQKKQTIQNAYNQPISATRVYKRNQTTVRQRGPSNKRGAIIQRQFTDEDDQPVEPQAARQIVAKTSRLVFAQERNQTQKMASSSNINSTDSNSRKNQSIKVYKSNLKNTIRDQIKRGNGSTERGSNNRQHVEINQNSRDPIQQSQDSCFCQPNNVITPMSAITRTGSIANRGSGLQINGQQNSELRQSSFLNERIQRVRLDTFKDEPVQDSQENILGQNMRYSQQIGDFKIVKQESEDARKILNEDNPFESKVPNIKIKQSQVSPDKSIASKTTAAVDSSKNNSQGLNFRKSRRFLTDNRQGGAATGGGFRGSLQGNRRSYASNSQNLVLTDQDSECKYNDNTVMLSMPMSMHRHSITQVVIAEEEIDKEQDERTTTLKENESACQIFDENSFKDGNPNETPRIRYPHNRSEQQRKSDDAGVLCDSMEISVPKHLDSPQISITTVQNSDDEVEARRGLEGLQDDGTYGLTRKSTRSILHADEPDEFVKPARNNNYLREESAQSKVKPVKQSMEFIGSHSDDEMMLELDMDEFKINKL